MDGTFLYNIIQSVIFLGGLITIIVKFTDRIKTLEIDVSHMKDKQKEHDTRYDEFSAKLDNISGTLIRLETLLETRNAKQ